MVGCTARCYLYDNCCGFFPSFLLGFTETNTNEADLNVKYRLGLTCKKACLQMEEIDDCLAILLFLFLFFFLRAL